jgi:hypothetical protein
MHGTWRKSSFSGPEINCVEVARGSAVVGVRDSKNTRSVLVLAKDSWTSLISHVSADE